MRARRLNIHLRLTVGPILLTFSDESEAVTCALDDELRQAINVNTLSPVFSNQERIFALAILQQIKDALIVDLDKAAVDACFRWHLVKK